VVYTVLLLDMRFLGENVKSKLGVKQQ